MSGVTLGRPATPLLASPYFTTSDAAAYLTIGDASSVRADLIARRAHSVPVRCHPAFAKERSLAARSKLDAKWTAVRAFVASDALHQALIVPAKAGGRS